MQYSDKVMDHFLNPRNVGQIEDASGVGEVGNAKCGDIMKIFLDIEDGIIKDVKFQTFGCGSAIASSSMATEMVKGKSIHEALALTNKAVAEALDGLPPVKMHCSVLAEQAIKAALIDYAEKNNIHIPELDGVVIDSETTFRTYEEIFDIDILKGNNLINKKEPKFQARYNWSSNQEKEFIEKYFLKVSRESGLMSGFIAIYELLKKQGHEFVVITARGGYVKEMKDDAIRLLEENNIKFDKYYWNVEDKLEICKKEKVDIMIDDDWNIIKKIADCKIM